MLEELKRHREMVQSRIQKSFESDGLRIDSLNDEIFKAQETEVEYDDSIEKAKHNDGDMHPNGKWVWVSSANGGKGDWRTNNGRAHKKHSAGGNEGGSEKLDSQASKTDTSTLKKVANSNKAPQDLKDAAKKELQSRGEGGNKPENRKQKEERIRNEIREFLKNTDTHNESTEYHKKLKDIMEREHLNMNSIINIAGNFMGASQAMKAMKAIKEMKSAESGNGKNDVHEKLKKDTIKDILNNGAGVADDRFIDNNKTDYYKSVMKKYGVSNVGELADKLGEEDGGYDELNKIYTKMLRQIPASAFYKEYGD